VAVLGIVTAMPSERAWLCGAAAGRPPVVELSGIGAAGARRAALRCVQRGAQALASWGCAAGLDPALGPGSVLVPARVIGPDAEVYPTPDGWRHRLLERVGDVIAVGTDPVATAETVLETAGAKADLFERSGAAAADMESAAVAGLAVEHGLPFLVVRVVLDAAGAALPGRLDRVVDAAGRVRTSGLVARLALRPKDWPRWLGLARSLHAARRSMKTLWAAAAPDLALADSSSDSRSGGP